MTQPLPPELLIRDQRPFPYIIEQGAFGPVPKTVPLVWYDEEGQRHVVGEATVYPDGLMEGRLDQ